MIMAIKIEIPANDISLFDLGAFDFEKRSGRMKQLEDNQELIEEALQKQEDSEAWEMK
jgi:hypothetical protein